MVATLSPMFTPVHRTLVRPALALVAVAILAACASTATPTGSTGADPSGPTAASPGEPFGTFPGVDEFGYTAPTVAGVERFETAANESLDGEHQVQIVDAAIASRGEEDVLAIAFSVPGTTDEEAVDAFARILDGMEDGFQAGSERALGGSAYVMTNENETVVIGPWGRTDDLVFLFAVGPTGTTQDYASAVLNGQ